MSVAEAKAMARQWIETSRGQWPGLRAAHLVGGITSMLDAAPFPAHKDLDLHLIVDEDSAALAADGPFPPMVEVEHHGLLIEAGIKPVSEYCSPEVVLANPEIAHHLTVDSVLYDPNGLLAGLRGPVTRDFAQRRWVCARLAHERQGHQGALALVPMASAMWGATGEANLLGYSFTYVAAALAVAGLRPPRIGSRMLLHLRDRLAEAERPELYEEALAVLGLQGATPGRVRQLLCEGGEAFDLAVRVRRSPHPFQHKLYAHLRPYFVEACRSMLDEGHHREALGWLTPYICSATDVIRADGPEEAQPRFAGLAAELLRDLGLDTPEGRAARFERARRLHEQCFALAEDIVAHHPDITG